MLITEGTYPYNGGGVSTWSHILCSKIKNVDYTIYSINANLETVPKYKLPTSVKNIIQLPIWTPEEPSDYISYGTKYYKTVGRKQWTTGKVIKKEFIPLFNSLLEFIYSDQNKIEDLDTIFYNMWIYFETYDYKKTMRHKTVWDNYKKTVSKLINSKNNPDASLLDLTIGMRWIYRFLIPISIVDIPKVDVAHLTLSGFPLIPALIANYKHGAKIVLTEHGVFIRERLLAISGSEYPFFLKNMLIKFSEAIARLCFYKSEHIISVNKFNRKWEELYGANPDKIKVIYNGVDENLFIPREKPKHLKNTPTVVALARIFDLKDVITMIKSCAVVKKEIPNVEFLIYGDDKAVPEYTEECLALIDKLNLKDNFKLMGPKQNPHLLFSEGDISVLTSISEGFPYTVIESMACGVPVVATDVGGVKEALDKDSGFLCKPKNAAEIGQRITQLLQNKELRLKMSKHARKRVVDNFTVNNFIEQYEHIYTTTIT